MNTLRPGQSYRNRNSVADCNSAAIYHQREAAWMSRGARQARDAGDAKLWRILQGDAAFNAQLARDLMGLGE